MSYDSVTPGYEHALHTFDVCKCELIYYVFVDIYFYDVGCKGKAGPDVHTSGFYLPSATLKMVAVNVL